jgi:hypothetical protein
MLDSKNVALEKKEDYITRLKRQMEDQRKGDQEEIAELQKQLGHTGDNALGRMREIISKHDA